MESEDPRSEGLGRAIRVIRTGQDMSRKDLSGRSGLSYSYLAEIESGTKTPSSKALGQIAEALGVAVHELMEAAHRWEHTPPPHSFEELRDTARLAMREPPSSSGDAPFSGLAPASLRRAKLFQLGQRGRRGRRGSSRPEDEASEQLTSGDRGLLEGRTVLGGDPVLGEDARELLRLLSGLEPEDRERLLDLARRLAGTD